MQSSKLVLVAVGQWEGLISHLATSPASPSLRVATGSGSRDFLEAATFCFQLQFALLSKCGISD